MLRNRSFNELRKIEEDLEKAKVIELGSRKVLADMPTNPLAHLGKPMGQLTGIQGGKKPEPMVTPKPKRVSTEDWIDPELHEGLKARYGSNRKVLSHIDRLATKGHDEPYAGNDTASVAWRASPKGEDSKISHIPAPIPAKVSNLKGVLGKKVATGNGPDPFSWMDSKYGVTNKLLERHKNLPLEIHTRSDLIAHDDYMKHLNPRKHTIHIHVATDNDQVSRQIEPGAPSPKRRYEAARKLEDAGHKVHIVHDVLRHPDIHPSLDLKLENAPANIPVKQNIVKLGREQVSRIHAATGTGSYRGPGSAA